MIRPLTRTCNYRRTMINNVSQVTAKRCTAVQELRVRDGGQGTEAER